MNMNMNMMNNNMNMNNMNMNMNNNMNQMNNINFNNNMNQMNMINCPFKGINNNTIINGIEETSFINSVLQAFSNLSCVKNWYYFLNTKKEILLTNSNCSITKELFILLTSFFMKKQPDSSNTILHFINKFKTLYNQEINSNPIDFINYFLELLHFENNFPLNLNYDVNQLNNLNLQNRRNNTYVYNLFNEYMKQSHNSFISQYFFNIIKYEMKCQNCSCYYNYTYKTILEFDLDLYRNYRDQAFPQKSCMNLNMDECFTNYIGGKQYNCIYCNNPGFIYSTISRPSKVLIISFKRNNHNYSCDIDFDLKINIAKYCSKDNISGINSNTVYNLKAIIGLNNNQQYLADVLINNFWFRFINNQVNTLVNVNNDIHIFEPQLLIYELNNNMQDNQFIKMWMMKNYQMQNMKMNIMMQKQMMMKKQKMDQILNGILGQ